MFSLQFFSVHTRPHAKQYALRIFESNFSAVSINISLATLFRHPFSHLFRCSITGPSRSLSGTPNFQYTGSNHFITLTTIAGANDYCFLLYPLVTINTVEGHYELFFVCRLSINLTELFSLYSLVTRLGNFFRSCTSTLKSFSLQRCTPISIHVKHTTLACAGEHCKGLK